LTHRPEFIHLIGDVADQDRESHAGPDDRFGHGPVKRLIPTGDAKNDAHLDKYQRDRVTPRHPLPVLGDHAVDRKIEADAGRNHQDCGIDHGRDGERARRALGLVEILDIDAERRERQRAGDVYASDDPMEFRVAGAQPVRKLHRHQHQSETSGNPVPEQPPLERCVVIPDRMVRNQKKRLVVVENVGHHRRDHGEDDVFRPQRGGRLHL
jgi:hypothetical protein